MSPKLDDDDAASLGRVARITGAVYFLYFLAGFPLTLRSSLVVPGDAAATAAKITASQVLYRITIVTDLLAYCLYLGLACLFYLLLRRVDRQWAAIGTLFTIGGCIVLIAATSVLAAPLALLTGNAFDAISAPERQALALLALNIYKQAFLIGLLLFGVQWLIMGPLFARSRFVPRPIGYLLTLAGVAWLAFAVVSTVAPPVGAAMQPVVLAIGSVAEVVLALWLLIRGARVRSGGTIDTAAGSRARH